MSIKYNSKSLVNFKYDLLVFKKNKAALNFGFSFEVQVKFVWISGLPPNRILNLGRVRRENKFTFSQFSSNHSVLFLKWVLICLFFVGQREGALADEDSADMDGENGRGFDEYEWAGQKRIRATALLEGGFRGTDTSDVILC